MLKVYNYDIVCQEIPDEITLALNISNCPNHCPGCHSPWLWRDEGEPLTQERLASLVEPYQEAVTCLCIMGGDREPQEVARLLQVTRKLWPHLKTAWYSGREQLPAGFDITSFDYIKLGAYIAERGGLTSATTNQKLYKVGVSQEMIPVPFKK